MSSAASLLPELFQSDRVYGWSQGMRSVTRAVWSNREPAPGPILELGCGGATFLADLHNSGRRVVGLDLHSLALVQARRALGGDGPGLIQADVQRLPCAEGSFAAVVALDVLDQKGVELAAALEQSWRVLREGGLLVVRVSAHEWLHSEHDDAFNTGRRYDPGSLASALRAAGFGIERMTYANTLLGLPVVFLRLFQRWQFLPFSESLYRVQMFNGLLLAALQMEAHWLRRWDLPIGLSLFAVARKPAAMGDGES